jgi:hypothetical protein
MASMEPMVWAEPMVWIALMVRPELMAWTALTVAPVLQNHQAPREIKTTTIIARTTRVAIIQVIRSSPELSPQQMLRRLRGYHLPQ